MSMAVSSLSSDESALMCCAQGHKPAIPWCCVCFLASLLGRNKHAATVFLESETTSACTLGGSSSGCLTVWGGKGSCESPVSYTYQLRRQPELRLITASMACCVAESGTCWSTSATPKRSRQNLRRLSKRLAVEPRRLHRSATAKPSLPAPSTDSQATLMYTGRPARLGRGLQPFA